MQYILLHRHIYVYAIYITTQIYIYIYIYAIYITTQIYIYAIYLYQYQSTTVSTSKESSVFMLLHAVKIIECNKWRKTAENDR